MNSNQKRGATLGDLNKQLAEKDLESKAVDKLEECLEATNTIYDIKGKVLRKFPDFKTKLRAITLGLAYTAGKPVERCEVITKHHTSLEDLRAQAKASPEFQRVLRELLDETRGTSA